MPYQEKTGGFSSRHHCYPDLPAQPGHYSDMTHMVRETLPTRKADIGYNNNNADMAMLELPNLSNSCLRSASVILPQQFHCRDKAAAARLCGVGLSLTTRHMGTGRTRVVILAIRPKSPAAVCGRLALDDEILRVDETSTEYMDPCAATASKLVRGPKDSLLRLSLKKCTDGTMHEVYLLRANGERSVFLFVFATASLCCDGLTIAVTLIHGSGAWATARALTRGSDDAGGCNGDGSIGVTIVDGQKPGTWEAKTVKVGGGAWLGDWSRQGRFDDSTRLEEGDIIVCVDGNPVHQIETPLSVLRGAPFTRVSLQIERRGKSVRVDVIRTPLLTDEDIAVYEQYWTILSDALNSVVASHGKYRQDIEEPETNSKNNTLQHPKTHYKTLQHSATPHNTQDCSNRAVASRSLPSSLSTAEHIDIQSAQWRNIHNRQVLSSAKEREKERQREKERELSTLQLSEMARRRGFAPLSKDAVEEHLMKRTTATISPYHLFANTSTLNILYAETPAVCSARDFAEPWSDQEALVEQSLYFDGAIGAVESGWQVRNAPNSHNPYVTCLVDMGHDPHVRPDNQDRIASPAGSVDSLDEMIQRLDRTQLGVSLALPLINHNDTTPPRDNPIEKQENILTGQTSVAETDMDRGMKMNAFKIRHVEAEIRDEVHVRHEVADNPRKSRKELVFNEFFRAGSLDRSLCTQRDLAWISPRKTPGRKHRSRNSSRSPSKSRSSSSDRRRSNDGHYALDDSEPIHLRVPNNWNAWSYAGDATYLMAIHFQGGVENTRTSAEMQMMLRTPQQSTAIEQGHYDYALQQRSLVVERVERAPAQPVSAPCQKISPREAAQTTALMRSIRPEVVGSMSAVEETDIAQSVQSPTPQVEPLEIPPRFFSDYADEFNEFTEEWFQPAPPMQSPYESPRESRPTTLPMQDDSQIRESQRVTVSAVAAAPHYAKRASPNEPPITSPEPSLDAPVVLERWVPDVEEGQVGAGNSVHLFAFRLTNERSAALFGRPTGHDILHGVSPTCLSEERHPEDRALPIWLKVAEKSGAASDGAWAGSESTYIHTHTHGNMPTAHRPREARVLVVSKPPSLRHTCATPTARATHRQLSAEVSPRAAGLGLDTKTSVESSDMSNAVRASRMLTLGEQGYSDQNIVQHPSMHEYEVKLAHVSRFRQLTDVNMPVNVDTHDTSNPPLWLPQGTSTSHTPPTVDSATFSPSLHAAPDIDTIATRDCNMRPNRQ